MVWVGEIVEPLWETNVILADEITKLEPHRGFYVKPGEKLITAKPIMKIEAPDIVKYILKPENIYYITFFYHFVINMVPRIQFCEFNLFGTHRLG